MIGVTIISVYFHHRMQGRYVQNLLTTCVNPVYKIKIKKTLTLKSCITRSKK